jgi:hypothetical protein
MAGFWSHRYLPPARPAAPCDCCWVSTPSPIFACCPAFASVTLKFLVPVTCGVHQHHVAAVARRLLDRLRRHAGRVLLVPCSAKKKVFLKLPQFACSALLAPPCWLPLPEKVVSSSKCKLQGLYTHCARAAAPQAARSVFRCMWLVEHQTTRAQCTVSVVSTHRARTAAPPAARSASSAAPRRPSGRCRTPRSSPAFISSIGWPWVATLRPLWGETSSAWLGDAAHLSAASSAGTDTEARATGTAATGTRLHCPPAASV